MSNWELNMSESRNLKLAMQLSGTQFPFRYNSILYSILQKVYFIIKYISIHNCLLYSGQMMPIVSE